MPTGDEFVTIVNSLLEGKRPNYREIEHVRLMLNQLGTITSWITPDGGVRTKSADIGGAVRITNEGLLVRNGSVQTGRIENDGDLAFGSNLAAAATTGFQVFSNAQTYNGESMGAGDILIGDNSSGKPNILWDASVPALYFRQGTVINSVLSADASLSNIGASYKDAAITLTSGSAGYGNWDTLYWDDASFWSSGEPTRFTIPVAGTYQWTGYAAFNPNATGYRAMMFYVDRTSLYAAAAVPTAGSSQATVVTGLREIALTAGQYVELYLLQNSGGDLGAACNMSCRRIR